MGYIDNCIQNSNIIIYTTEDGLSKIETTFDGDTVCLFIDQIQAMRHNPMYMPDYVEHPDNVLKATGVELLQDAGIISHAQAIEKATEEYKKYQVQNLSPVEEEYLETIKNLHSVAKKETKN